MADPFAAYAALEPPKSKGDPFAAYAAPRATPTPTHGRYDAAGLRGLWVKAGGSQADADIMAQVALNESTGDPSQTNPSGAAGLWQILPSAHPETKGMDLHDPLTNAKIAVRLHRESGLSPWEDSRSKGAYGGWGKYLANQTAPTPTASPTPAPPFGASVAEAGTVVGHDPFAAYAKVKAAPAPTPHAGAAPTGQKALPPAKPGSGPLDAFAPVLGGAARAAGTGVGNVIDVLQRPQHAVAAGLTGGVGTAAQTAVHGQSEASADQTRAQLRQKIGIAPFYDALASKSWTSPSGIVIPGHVLQGFIDFAIDTGTDPLTYLGGLGLIEKGIAAGGRVAVPALVRAVNAAEAIGKGSKIPGVQAAGRLAGQAYDFATIKGPTLRKLVARSGAEGVAQHQGLRQINSARRTMQTDLGQTLVNQYRKVVQGLTPDEEAELYKAIHEGTTAALPPKLGMRAAAFKRVTDSLAHLSADPELTRELELGKPIAGPAVGPVQRTGGGFQLPNEFERFKSDTPRGLQMPERYRQHYVPTAHDVSQFSQAQQAAGGITSLDPTAVTANAQSLEDVLHTHVPEPEPATVRMSAEDKALRERSERATLLAPELQRKVIETRLRGGASAIAAHDAEQAAARLFGVKDFSKIPPEAKAFFIESYTRPEDRSALQNLGSILKGAVDIPKHGLFALPFRHMMNIGFLSLLADPSLSNVTGTAGRFARLLLERSPEARAKILGKSLKYGVTGAPSIDRDAGWTGRIPILGEIYKASNHTLWTFDDAAKATRFQKLLTRYQRAGMAEPDAAAKAANDVGAEMVNYGERSPLTETLAYLLPFATWRTKMPGAIARATLKHPERPLALSRIAPELTGDEQQGPPGSGKVGKAYTPAADAYRALDNPAEYARAAAGWPLQMALSIAQGAGGQGNNYWTYYKNPDARYALNETVGSFPGGDYLLRFPELLGKPALTEFKDQGQPTSIIPNLIRSQTGFGLVSGPNKRELDAKRHYDEQRAIIANLRSRGYNAYADTLQKKLDTYLRYNPLFQK